MISALIGLIQLIGDSFLPVVKGVDVPLACKEGVLMVDAFKEKLSDVVGPLATAVRFGGVIAAVCPWRLGGEAIVLPVGAGMLFNDAGKKLASKLVDDMAAFVAAGINMPCGIFNAAEVCAVLFIFDMVTICPVWIDLKT